MASNSRSEPKDTAEASTSAKDSEKDAAPSDDGADGECAVCLQNCTYPVKLSTCAHVFCFLCIKGNCVTVSSYFNCLAVLYKLIKVTEVLSVQTYTIFLGS